MRRDCLKVKGGETVIIFVVLQFLDCLRNHKNRQWKGANVYLLPTLVSRLVLQVRGGKATTYWTISFLRNPKCASQPTKLV